MTPTTPTHPTINNNNNIRNSSSSSSDQRNSGGNGNGGSGAGAAGAPSPVRQHLKQMADEDEAAQRGLLSVDGSWEAEPGGGGSGSGSGSAGAGGGGGGGGGGGACFGARPSDGTEAAPTPGPGGKWGPDVALHLEYMPWMGEVVGKEKGSLSCPKCTAELGHWRWTTPPNKDVEKVTNMIKF